MRPPDFEAALEAALLHLLPGGMSIKTAGLAIGFSGGGDSTALLYGLRKYAPFIHVFIVDHNLRSGAGLEAKAAQTRAREWGFQADILTWQTGPVTSGIQAKARRARYGLIGAAMRARGLGYLLTGHTADDQAETCLMRYERGSDWRGAAGMAPRVYAPVWPQLAGVSLLRPLLGQNRKDLRRYNQHCGLMWAEDPSNENRGFARIRARDYLQTRPDLRQMLLNTANILRIGRCQETADILKWITEQAEFSPQGFARVKGRPPRRALFHLIRAVSGQGTMIDPAALRRLGHYMDAPDFKAATLGGVQIIRENGAYLYVRDPAMAKGRRGDIAAVRTVIIGEGRHIWDGRYEVHNKSGQDVTLRPAWGHIDAAFNKFPQMKSIPVQARPSLPLLMTATNDIMSLGSHASPEIEVKPLYERRLVRSLTDENL